MPRHLVALVLATLATAPTFAQDANPEVNGKRMLTWMQDLKSERNARLRRVAVVSLGDLARAKRSDPMIIRGVAAALGSALRNDGTVSVRAQAVEVLGQVAVIVLEEKDNDPTSVAIDLAESLRLEKDPAIRQRVAKLLGLFRQFGKPGVTPLTECLTATDPALRQTAADSLGRIGGEARPATDALLKALTDKEKGVRAAAAFALGRVDVADVNKVALALVPLLKNDPAVEVRQEVVTTVGLLNDRTSETLTGLAVGLSDQEAEVRRRTGMALGRLRTAAKGVTPQLKKAIADDPSPRVRMDCLRALVGAHEEDPKELLPFLITRLDVKTEKDYTVRVAVAEELGGMGLNAVPALAALRKAQTDPQLKVREAAGKAIQSITKSSAPPKK